jgi:hypothetical protein
MLAEFQGRQESRSGSPIGSESKVSTRTDPANTVRNDTYQSHNTEAPSPKSKYKVRRITHALVQAPVFQKPLWIEAFWIRIDFLSKDKLACSVTSHFVAGSTDLIA